MSAFKCFIFPLALAMALASCTPYQPPPIPPGPVDPGLNKTLNDQAQKDIEAERQRLKKQASKKKKSTNDSLKKAKKEVKKPVENVDQGLADLEKKITEETPPAPKPKPKPKKVIPRGIPVPGREGFVYSPFDNEIVDVRKLPSGTPVRNPRDPKGRVFRVP